MKSELPPKLPYPRLLWYQEKRSSVSQEDKDTLFKYHYEASLNKVRELFPKSVESNLIKLATRRTNMLVESIVNVKTVIKKVVANNEEEHAILKKTIEESGIFVQWYQE